MPRCDMVVWAVNQFPDSSLSKKRLFCEVIFKDVCTVYVALAAKGTCAQSEPDFYSVTLCNHKLHIQIVQFSRSTENRASVC